VSSVLLVAHHERAEAATLARATADWLAARGHDAFLTAEDASALGLADLDLGLAPSSAAVAISLGGDGTVLRTVQILRGAVTPIIGVNVGLLGYLTEVEPPSLTAALERWFAGPTEGQWELDERMLLDLTVHPVGEAPPRSFTALNEGVIEKQQTGHTVRLHVSVDGAPFTSYAADGLILATPTGSTAYSMSARGPVVSPRLKAVLLTPVSPHMLFDRTLVLDQGDKVTVAPSEQVARFVRFERLRFHQILKAKFGLTDR
jgi:NAD+ kinase